MRTFRASRFSAVLLVVQLLISCGGGRDADTTAAPLSNATTTNADTSTDTVIDGRVSKLATASEVVQAAASARYVRLEAISGINGNPWASVAEFNLLDASGAVMSRAGWTASADSAEMAGEVAPAAHAIDGEPYSIWHTQWQGSNPPMPHVLTIDLGSARSVGGFKYLPRQIGSNGRIAGWRFYVSPNGSSWTQAAEGVFADSASEVTVALAPASTTNQAPVLAAVDSKSSVLGAAVSQALSASDANGDALSWSAAGLPTGLAISAVSGVITGTPTAPGSFNVIVQVSDGRNGTASASFTWTVTASASGAVTARFVRLEATSEVNGNPWTSLAEFNLIDAAGATISRSGWTATADSAEMTGEVAPASRAIDGDPYTLWHTQWANGSPGMPHALTINLNTSRTVGGFKVLPRQLGINGRIATWRFYVSSDGTSWVLCSEGSFANNETEKIILLGASTPTAPANQMPTLAPITPQEATVGQPVSIAPQGVDPDGTALTYSATGLPAGVAVNRATGAISGTPTSAGTFTVTVTATDSLGGVATRTFTLTVAAATTAPTGAIRYVRLEALSEVNGNSWSSIAEFNLLDVSGAAISRAGWTATADSQETSGEYAPAGNAIDGNLDSFWHTSWQGSTPPLPHTFTVDIGAARTISGFRLLPRQTGSNGRIANWRLLTSMDGSTWSPTAQGTFANTADEKTVSLGATTPPTTTPSPNDNAALRTQRATRIAAFAAGPLVAGTPWRANETVAADTVRRIGGGQHLVYTTAGTTGGTQPTLSATVPDGRPIFDGSAVAYVNGRVASSSRAGAPIVGSAVNAAAAGLTQTDFALGDFKAPRLAAVQGCRSISTGFSFIGHYCYANGPAAGSGNATAIASGQYGAGMSNAFVYHANSWEEEFVVIDQKFGLVFANSSSPINVEVDGVPVHAGGTRSTGVEGWTMTLDYQGVIKRRTVRVISGTGSVAPTLRGVALSAQGSVESGTTATDQVLILGDSINATVVPTTEAGAQMASFWVQRYLGFGAAINMAVGGSGYISQNANSFNIPTLLANPVNQQLIAGYAPNITHVIIGAGFNDRARPLATVQAAALATWRAVRAQLPNAKISITDGWSGSSGPDADAIALAAALQASFNQWGDGNSRMIHSVGVSAATAYVSGTGHAGIAITSGNSSVYTSIDGVHPSPAGARYIARRLSDDITSVWGGAY